MFEIDLKSRKSIYEQVTDNLKELIATGVLSSDEKLPSVRAMSKMLTVNPNTVQKAYRELEYQGYIYTASGLGTFVTKREDMPIDTAKIEKLKEVIREAIRELLLLGMSLDEIGVILKELKLERGEGNDQSK